METAFFNNKGKPYIAIAGEVHNSSASSLVYMEHVWEKAEKLGLNTVLLPVSWELLEPEEGTFCFDLVDGLIAQAREHGMKIVFLWFGTWKNAQCMYAPEWVKTDLQRFPRAQIEKGKNKTRLARFYGFPYTTLSYLGEETNRTDARAFAMLMRHIRECDEEIGTVIGVQVENETGIQGSDREHSEEADRLYEESVPAGLIRYLKENPDSVSIPVRTVLEQAPETGNWSTVFRELAGEAFSAFHIAKYVERVAQAGKKEYSLPMYVNCWLDKGEEAGVYPSGGPVEKMMPIWKYAAPSIDFFAPDIYVTNFCDICDAYKKNGNPLFVPETAAHAYAAPRLVYVIGHYHAIGYAPFGFEDMGERNDSAAGFLFGMDITDPLLKKPQDPEEYHFCAKNLNDMMPLLTKAYGTSNLQAVISERMDMTPLDFGKGAALQMSDSNAEHDTMIFGDFGFRVLMNVPMVTRADGVCMILKANADTYYILANGCMLRPFSMERQKTEYDIICLEEGWFEAGRWVCGRRLNGDEAASLVYNDYTLLRLRVFQYQ